MTGTAPVRLGPSVLSPAMYDALRRTAVFAPASIAVLELAGPGAVTAFQGLLTNDIEGPGAGAFVYGALLTPKGMIVVEGWAARLEHSIRFTVPATGRERALEIFAKWVPPRLARSSDRTAECTVLRVAGARALAIAEAAGVPVPPSPGRVLRAGGDAAAVESSRPPEVGPFALQVVVAPGDVPALEKRLAAAGGLRVEPAALELPRILAGWPSLEAEVDDRTIPQEVRFDEIGGVSYTKGCYTGQETVSRLHFRGHTNRHLRGLEFEAEPDAADPLPVRHMDREVGRVTSIAWLPDDGRWVGLAVVRREVLAGAIVRAGSVDARVVELPFTLARPQPA